MKGEIKTIKKYQSKEWLEKRYIREKLSTVQIAKLCEVCDTCIGRNLKKFNIPIRSNAEAKIIEYNLKNANHQDKKWLRNKYLNEKLSTTQIAKLCRVSDVTVGQWLKKYNIPRRSNGEAVYLSKINYCKLSEEIIEWIEGELLGDGCIFPSSPYSAFFSYSSKYLEYINYVINTLQSFGIKCGEIQKRYHEESNTYSYSSHSYTYKELLNIRKHWYPNGKKIVPRDINLTPLMVRQWYIGDGCLKRQKGCKPRIELNTCGFSISDVDWLVNQLKKINLKAVRWVTHNTIGISTHSAKTFLNYIGKCPVECYSYKFEY